jgi:protein disulfide-isomerase A1
VDPVIKSVAEIFKSDENTLIAKIDASKNDIYYEGVTIKGYPTFYLFAAGNKTAPLEYTGDRSYLDLVNFITVNGAVNKVSKKENEGTAAGAEEAEISLDI